LLALLMPLRQWWPVQVLLLPLLLVLPGILLLRALRIPGKSVASFPIYVPCASLVVLLGSGLVVDLIGLLAGMAAPLRTGPVLAGLEITCLVLLFSSRNAPPDVAIPPGSLARPFQLMWPLILPLVAAAGALRLNSGHGAAVALAAVGMCVALLIVTLVIAPRLGRTPLAVILYAVGLAMMWSFSLRGNLVYGFDIASEYHAMQETVVTGIWHPAHPGDAYGALLSITVLPAELHWLSGVPGLVVFKVVYPAVGAVFPVAIFALARRVLSRRWAFTAAAFIITQATFFQQLPALARQEIALLLFAGLVGVMLDSRLPERSRWALAGLFGLGMAVSHYSTTYLAIIMLGLALMLQFGVSWVRQIPRITWPVPVALGAAVAGAVIWYGPMTQSSSNVSQFVDAIRASGFNLLPNHAGNLLSTYFQGESSRQLQPAQYARLVHDFYSANEPFVSPLPDAGNPAYSLRAVVIPSPAVTWPLGYNALNLAELASQQLANVLAAVGALLTVFSRKVSVIARQVGLLGLAAVLILTVVRFSGTLAESYNPERAFLQTMMVLAITLCWPLQALARRPKWRQTTVLALTAACVTVLHVTAGGLAGVVLGGGTATNLANSGGDYDQFYMTTPELASASWLGRSARPGQLVYADRYGQLRLFAMNGYRGGMLSDITPLTLDQHAWVYASRTNVTDRSARVLFNNQSVQYAFPFGFLGANYDTVFTDGSSEVFHR